MKKYRLYNNILGWFSFIIAAIVYLLTIEPTASFWDCGEFIASAYKMEVGHPPGAPFFMIMARFFTLFTSDPTNVAKMVNALSALASAFTILFLFWTITHFARKILVKTDEDYNTGNILTILGSGFVGALAYTFSDTFWFSAVEGEVYATSSLFTAVVFWAILKWENIADQKFSNRWIIFIAYLIGLSIGVHLLNLLAIPAIVLVYYFKKYKVSRNGVIMALIVSALVLGAIMYGIIPGLVQMVSKFELFFVNTMGLPFNSGILVFAILLIAALVAGIYYTKIHHPNHNMVSFLFTAAFFLTGIPLIFNKFFIAIIIAIGVYLAIKQFAKNQYALLNTIMLGFAVIVIGYSSFSMIVIRSLADPPMDQNNPETLFKLLSYLNREQYGDRPLFHGQYYSAPIIDSEEGKPTYEKEDDKYEISHYRPEYIYEPEFTTVFPRMYSREPNHVDAYEKWAEIEGEKIQRTNPRGESETLVKPSFGENLKFFFRYQIGYMYLRYFMWNFAGRQNDIQGHFKTEITKGNWLSGIPFIDEARLGPQDKVPEELKNNRARNKYYLLPLLLGLAGAFFHYKRDKKDFWIVMTLFILTGLAIVVYLNQTPFQPRERDYAYAGSFYAFAIWIGLGVLSITELFKKKLPVPVSAVLATVISLALVPSIMAKENWDDHDRSGRYTARDFAYNYLNTCAPHGIIFTNGDNDTFPLWYAQEVEGIRTDVRVVNLSYLGADWYIKQMERKAYESEPLPFTLEERQYRQGNRDIVYLIERVNRPVDLKEAMQFLADDSDRTKQLPNYRERVDYFPSKQFFLSHDSAKLVQSGIVPEHLADKMERLEWSLNGNYVTKNHLMVLDLLATSNWDRPIYYAITVSSDNYLNLEDYFLVQGLAYRITPVKAANSEPGQHGTVDTRNMYENLMNKYKWGGVSNPDVYLDENNLRMLSNFRNSFARLAHALHAEGKADSAKAVLDRCTELMPHERVPYNYFTLPIIEGYYKVNQIEQANEIASKMLDVTNGHLTYYFGLPSQFNSESVEYEKRLNMHILQELGRITKMYNQEELSQEIDDIFQNLMVSNRMNPNMP